MISSDINSLAASLCEALAVAGCLYILLCAAATVRFPRRGPTPLPMPPAVTILKPLYGEEPGLAARLSAFGNQKYGGGVEMICGLRDASDAAASAVKQIVRDGAGADLHLVIDAREYGFNRKISNLVNMTASASHDIFVLSDSDIEVAPDYLVNVVAALAEPGVGAVTCLYHGISCPGVWARLGALSVNAYFLPSAVFALCARLEHPCFGSTIALRRNTLARIGGFVAFADSLADDYAIGAAVRSNGDRVVTVPFSVGHVHFEERLRDLLGHELRVARTIRTLQPLGHSGSVINHPFVLALVAAGCGSEYALVLAVLALACRIVLCRCVEYRFGLSRQAYWLVPLRSLLSFAVFVASFFGTNVSWRGTHYHVATDGNLVMERNSIS